MKVPFAVARRIFRQLSNDHRTIAMITIVPIIMTLVFGYAFQGETFNNPVVIVNLDEGHPFLELKYNTTFGKAIIEKLQDDDRVNIVLELTDFNQAKDMVKNRTVDGLIFLPANLSSSIISKSNTSIIIVSDEAEPAIGKSIFQAVFTSFSEGSEDFGSPNPLSIEHQFAFGEEEISGLDIALPGIIGYLSLFLVVLLTVILIVREDLEGTKARFISAPITKWQIMTGYMVGMMFFAVIISTVILLVALFIFNAHVRGSLLLAFAFVLYFALGSVMLALFLARIARNELQAVQLAVLVAIPSIALSGFMVPVNTLPDWLGVLSKVIPLTYAIEGLKSIMLRGLGIEGIMFEIGALTIYSIIAFLGAIIASKDTIA